MRGASRRGASVNVFAVAVLTLLSLLFIACGSESLAPAAGQDAPVSTSAPAITAVPINAAAVATAAPRPDGSQYVAPVIPTYAIQPLRTLPAFAPTDALRDNASLVAEWTVAYGKGFGAIAAAPGAAGHLAFVSSGADIYLADISSPERVEIEDRLGMAPGHITHLYSNSSLLVALTGDAGARDSGGPAVLYRNAAGEQLTVLSTIDGAFTRGTLSDDLAFLVAGEGGLHIFDLSDPAAPRRLSVIEPWIEADKPWEGFVPQIMDVAVVGGMAYIAAGEAGFVAFDVNDPSSPQRIGQFQTPGFAERVAVDGDRAFVANNVITPFTIWYLDITDPTDPQALGKYEDSTASGGIRSLHAQDGRVYFTSFSAGWIGVAWEFGVLDAAHPEQLTLVGKIVQQGDPGDFLFNEGIAFLPTSTGFVTIDTFRVTGESGKGRGGQLPKSIVDRIIGGGGVTKLALQDELLLLFTLGGFHVINLDAEGGPAEISDFSLNGKGPVEVETDRALFLESRDNNAMMEIYDVLSFVDPRNPTWAGRFERSFTRDSSEAALMCPESGYLDVCYAADQFQNESRLTLAVYGAGARSEDHSANLVVIGSEDVFRGEIRILGNHLYVVAGPNLFVFDVSEPREPVLVAKKPMQVESDAAGMSPQIWPSGDRLYVLFKGLWAFDISQPGEPVEIGYYPTGAIEMAVQDDRIALVDSNGRVEIVEIMSRP